MEGGLVTALMGFLRISYLFVCLEQDFDGGLNNEFELYNSQSSIHTSVLEQREIEMLLGQDAYSDILTMVVCPNFNAHDDLDARIFRKNIVWLVPKDSLPDDHQRSLPLQLGSLLIGYSQPGIKKPQMSLTEHYALKGRPLQNFLGTWSERNGLEVMETEMWERRSNLHGIPLLGSYFRFPPMAFKDKAGKVMGIVPDIVHAIQRATNFR